MQLIDFVHAPPKYAKDRFTFLIAQLPRRVYRGNLSSQANKEKKMLFPVSTKILFKNGHKFTASCTKKKFTLQPVNLFDMSSYHFHAFFKFSIFLLSQFLCSVFLTMSRCFIVSSRNSMLITLSSTVQTRVPVKFFENQADRFEKH